MKLKAHSDWIHCKGIFINGCIERGEGSAFRAKAHAHNFTIDPYFGWICFRSPKRIKDCFRLFDTQEYGEFDGEVIKTNQILLHEYAHILTPNHYHDDTFRKKLKEIGGHLNKRYQKQPRIIKGKHEHVYSIMKVTNGIQHFYCHYCKKEKPS